MLFKSEAFEQYFSERDLRKGYQLYEKGLVSLLSRNGPSETRYHIASEEGVIRKRSAHIISWECGCGKDFCQHLAALMFHLHQSGLELPANRARKKTVDIRHQLPAGSRVFSSGLQKLGKFERMIHPLLSPVLKLRIVDSAAAGRLSQGIRNIQAAQTGGGSANNRFYFSLAVIRKLIPLYARLDHNAIQEIKMLEEEFYRTISRCFRKGLQEDQKNAWYAVAFDSIRNNRALYSPAFSFFIPRMLLLAPDHEELKEIRSALHKRKYLLKNAVDFDPLAITRQQLRLTQNADFWENKVLLPQDEPEVYIALGELFLVSENKKKAFDIFSEGVSRIDKLSIQFQEYLEYILQRAREYKMNSAEKMFLREFFIFGLFIRPGELDRFLHLAGEQMRATELLSLQKSIRRSDPYYFDKMSILLMAGDQFDDLITLISKQPERFMLLHEVAMKKGGIPDRNFISVYRKHLLAILHKTDNAAMHEKIISRSMQFFRSLPVSQGMEICEDLLMQIGKNKPVYRYLESVLHTLNLPA